MKKKIVGIVFLIMIATMIGSAADINVKENIKINASVVDDPVDVPVWEIGDSWTYNEHYNSFGYREDGTISYVWYHNCTSTYTVVDDSGDTYMVRLTSKDTEGRFNVGRYRLKFTPFYKLTQELEHRKTDLAYVHISTQEKGPVIWQLGNIGIPIPAYYSDIWESSYIPAFELFPFPLTAGKTGTFSSFTRTGHETLSLYFGLIKFADYDFSADIPARDYICNMASITVPAGTYEAYNISTDEGSAQNFSYSYYVPQVGSYAKWVSHHELDDSGKPVSNNKFELVSTTYNP
jgi:hypothetical protein